MPPRRISTRPPSGPARAKRPEPHKGDKKKKKKKRPQPGEGGRTLFVTIAAAAGASIVAVALRALVTSLAATKKASDALSRAASRPLYFTQHARERMECRRVTERQVREALKHGTVVRKKSEVGGVVGRKASGASFQGICDKLVVDADIPESGDGGEPFKMLQAVFKACPADTGVITVIDRVSKVFFSFFLLLSFSSTSSLALSFAHSSSSLFLFLFSENRPPTGSARADRKRGAKRKEHH